MTREEALNNLITLEAAPDITRETSKIINSIYDYHEIEVNKIITNYEKQIAYWKLSFNKQCKSTRSTNGNV